MESKKKTKPHTQKKKKSKAKSDRLTKAMEEFVLHLVAGDSQRAAYRAAYPACKAADGAVDAKASRLFSMVKVRARYDTLMARAANEAVAKAADVLAQLSDIALGRERFPAYDMFGNELERYPSMGARIKALELLGKHHKLFTEMREVQEQTTVKVVLTDD